MEKKWFVWTVVQVMNLVAAWIRVELIPRSDAATLSITKAIKALHLNAPSLYGMPYLVILLS